MATINHTKRVSKDKGKPEDIVGGSLRAAGVMADKRKDEVTKVKHKTILKGKSMACTCAICGSRMPYPSNIHAESHGFKGGWREAVQKHAFILADMDFEAMKAKFAHESKLLKGKAMLEYTHAQSENLMRKKKERALC